MKNIVITAVLISTFFLSIVCQTYVRCGVITRIQDDTVEVTDSCGLAWEYKGVEDYDVGDMVAMTMFKNYSQTIRDDLILRVTYAGYWME